MMLNLTTIPAVFYSERDMIPNNEELSPDLEWMLQSDQVNPRTLVQALVDKYYLWIYQKALSKLTFPEEARRTAREIIIQAVFESDTYRGTEPVFDWLDRISDLKIAERKELLLSQQMLNPSLIRFMSEGQEWETLSPGAIKQDILAINKGLKLRSRQQTKRITSQVLGLLGMIAMVVAIMVGSQGYWSPEISEETPEQVNASSDQDTSSETIPSQPEKEPEEKAHPPEPLTINSTSPEIRERINNSLEFWDTMWVEVVVTFYGPAGYDGPPIRKRHQFWIDPEQGGMLVSGNADNKPNFIERFDIPGSLEIGGQVLRGDLMTRVGSQVPWFVLDLKALFELPYVLNFIADTNFLDDQSRIYYGIWDKEEWAGVQTLVVELFDGRAHKIGRINLDPATGIALREVYYDPNPPFDTIIETSVSEIIFDQPIPKEWKRYDYAFLASRYFPSGPFSLESGENGRPEIDLPLSRRNFNLVEPSQMNLVFTKSEINTSDSDGWAKYGLFAAETYLGSIDLIDPLRMICDRSLGGNQIAFAEWNFYAPAEENKIYWFALDQLELSSIEVTPMAVHWIGFSPDERHLAVSGVSEVDGRNQFAIVDTKDFVVRTLPILANFNRITWNPDGTKILILVEGGSSFDTDVKRRLRIHSAVDGELIERIDVEEYTMTNNKLSIPLDGWTAEFQLGIQDITSCTAAPGG